MFSHARDVVRLTEQGGIGDAEPDQTVGRARQFHWLGALRCQAQRRTGHAMVTVAGRHQ